MDAVQSVVGSLDQQSILDDARKQAGLDDFGPDYFLEPMAKLLESARKEAHLTPTGIAIVRGRMVSGLVARLRMFDAIKKHPEIMEEKVNVAGVVCGLARTGSTMFHRMLAVAPGITAIKWFETQNYAPFPGEKRGEVHLRRKAGEAIMEGYVKAGLMSVHPFAMDEPDEEIIIIDQFFVGTMPESSMYVPSYTKWLESYDHHKAYNDLKTVLKFLQWQDVSRKGKRWVLKAPGHLATPDTLIDTFPETVLINTHRDPLQTIPSYCSFVNTIIRMSTDSIDAATVGRFTEKRWAGFLERFAKFRDRIGDDHFIDVRYEDLVSNPVEQARRVLHRLGADLTPEGEKAIREWLVENAREKREKHHYTMEEYGLSQEIIDKDFANYKSRFLTHA